MRCEAIKRGGGQCSLVATRGSYCYQHSPETAEARRRSGRRGGKVAGNGRGGISEVAEIKKHIKGVIAGTLSERFDKGAAAVAIQGYNSLLKAVELERKVRETDELAAEIEELKREHGRAS